MAKRRLGILGFLVCVCLCLVPCCAQAASTADAKEMIVPERACTLTVSYHYEGIVFPDLPVKLYRVAEVSADFQYTLTPEFLSSGLVLNGVQSAAEWSAIQSTLKALILSNGLAEDAAAATDENGQVRFEALLTGLYLVVPEVGVADGMQCVFDPALISLPGLGADGLWQYQVTASSKGVAIPPADADEEISFKVLKLWKGEDDPSVRPREIEVEIFRNGESCETVILSEENHWSYSWEAKDDGADWTVVERNVPAGYTVTLEERETTFVLTNTLIPPTTPPDEEPPETGDDANIPLYTILLYASGMLLLLLGIAGKKKRA